MDGDGCGDLCRQCDIIHRECMTYSTFEKKNADYVFLCVF